MRRQSNNLIDLGVDMIDFADTAAIIEQLDLLITVDTAAAHVAGALGHTDAGYCCPLIEPIGAGCVCARTVLGIQCICACFVRRVGRIGARWSRKSPTALRELRRFAVVTMQNEMSTFRLLPAVTSGIPTLHRLRQCRIGQQDRHQERKVR